MIVLATLALLVLPAPSPDLQPFLLTPGDYRHMPLSIRQTHVEVDCRFHVLSGAPTVHIEILPKSEFHLFALRRDHDRLSATSDATTGALRQIIDDPGDYEVVIANAPEAPAAMVTLEVSTDTNPDAANSARELSPKRRFAVILISFSLFFAIVVWSGLRLMRAIRQTH